MPWTAGRPRGRFCRPHRNRRPSECRCSRPQSTCRCRCSRCSKARSARCRSTAKHHQIASAVIVHIGDDRMTRRGEGGKRGVPTDADAAAADGDGAEMVGRLARQPRDGAAANRDRRGPGAEIDLFGLAAVAGRQPILEIRRRRRAIQDAVALSVAPREEMAVAGVVTAMAGPDAPGARRRRCRRTIPPRYCSRDPGYPCRTDLDRSSGERMQVYFLMRKPRECPTTISCSARKTSEWSSRP